MSVVNYRKEELLKKYPLDKEGVWKVLGEDPNCDFGGYHHQPELGIFTGKYGEVVEMALKLPGFWQWGAGGDIKPIEIRKVMNVDRYNELMQMKKDLESKLKDINNELRSAESGS